MFENALFTNRRNARICLNFYYRIPNTIMSSLVSNLSGILLNSVAKFDCKSKFRFIIIS